MKEVLLEEVCEAKSSNTADTADTNVNQETKKAQKASLREMTTITESERAAMRRALDSISSTDPKGIQANADAGKNAVDNILNKKRK